MHLVWFMVSISSRCHRFTRAPYFPCSTLDDGKIRRRHSFEFGVPGLRYFLRHLITPLPPSLPSSPIPSSAFVADDGLRNREGEMICLGHDLCRGRDFFQRTVSKTVRHCPCSLVPRPLTLPPLPARSHPVTVHPTPVGLRPTIAKTRVGCHACPT